MNTELFIEFILSVFAMGKAEINKFSNDKKNEVFEYLSKDIEIMEFVSELVLSKTMLFRANNGKFRVSNFKSKYRMILTNTYIGEKIEGIVLPSRNKDVMGNDKDFFSTDRRVIEKHGGIYNRKAGLVFSRKSKAGQSDVDLLTTLKGVIMSGFYLAGDSSGYDDIAILRALSYCIDNGISSMKVIKAIGTSRNEYATATRNVQIANRLVNQVRLLKIDVNINGSILSSLGGGFFVMMVTIQGESEWVGTANTNHYDKHHAYLTYLELSPKESLIAVDELTNREREEIASLVAKNETIEKTIIFIEGLISRPAFTIFKKGKQKGQRKVFCSYCVKSEDSSYRS